MNLSELEKKLLPLAKKHTPSGIEPLATVHQWCHAIATGSDLFASASHNLFNPIGGATAKKIFSYLGLTKKRPRKYVKVFLAL